MKTPWLILAAVLALVASAAPNVQRDRNLMRILNGLYFPGTYALAMPLDQRTKREALAPRRKKLRAGTRPICRGCYSGLMIVGPPVQESKNVSWNESYSESEGWSSEED